MFIDVDTGRMGRSGFIFNFVSLKDKAIIQKINRSVAGMVNLQLNLLD